LNEFNTAVSTSHSSAKDIFHADDALPLSSFRSHLKSLLPHFTNIYIDPPIQSSQRRATWLFNYLTNSGKDDPTDVLSDSNSKPIAPYLGKLRSIKSLAEQAVMRATADISARAHTKVLWSLAVHFPTYTLIG
jgi:intermediate cleaving peptidase 55